MSALISSAPVPVSQPPKAVSIGSTAVALRAGPAAAEEADLAAAVTEGVRYLKIGLLAANPAQPRRTFPEQEIRELADSIKSVGMLQPVLVRPRNGDGGAQFEIVAGERRWRAAGLAGLDCVPAIVKDIDDRQSLEIALVENVQRQDLNPIDEAAAYRRLVEEYSLTQKEVADQVGKDRASVANYIRLLSLSKPVIEHIQAGRLTIGHAKALLTIREPAAQASLASKVIRENLSVRALETIVSRVVVLDGGKAGQDGGPRGRSKRALGRTSFPEAADRLRKSLATKVLIKHTKTGGGRVVIEYFSEQELDRIVDKICS